jgi:hypothetical protein
LNTGHTYGTIADTMEIITGRKGKYLNTLEKYLICEISRENLHMNDIYTDTHNPISEALHEIYTAPSPTPVHYKYRSKHTTRALTSTHKGRQQHHTQTKRKTYRLEAK